MYRIISEQTSAEKNLWGGRCRAGETAHAVEKFKSGRTLRLLPAAILGLSLSGCGNLYLDAPAGRRVKLLTEDAPAQVRVEQVVWFKYWGNEPFSVDETHAATIIRENNLKEARIHMVNTFTDGIVSAFTGIFGFPRRTLVVEGNPYGAEDDEPSFDDDQAGKAIDMTKMEGGE